MLWLVFCLELGKHLLILTVVECLAPRYDTRSLKDYIFFTMPHGP